MMTSKEALKALCGNCEYHLSLSKQACPFRNISNEYCEEYEEIGRDLEILNTLKKYLHYSDSYYNNQADYGCAEITLRIEEDSIWLNDEQRKQLKKDFNKVKEWLEDDK